MTKSKPDFKALKAETIKRLETALSFVKKYGVDLDSQPYPYAEMTDHVYSIIHTAIKTRTKLRYAMRQEDVDAPSGLKYPPSEK